MLFLRIFHRLILLVLGHGAGKHVLRLEWHPIPLSEIQSEKEVAEQVNQYVAYLLFNLHCKHTLKFNQLFFSVKASIHPHTSFKYFIYGLKVACYERIKKELNFNFWKLTKLNSR